MAKGVKDVKYADLLTHEQNQNNTNEYDDDAMEAWAMAQCVGDELP